jgi:metallophosphoesterase (TIGR00282 family)
MRVLFIGDVVGSPGVRLLTQAVPRLVPEHHIDLVVANAENASGGTGMTPAVYRQLREAGVDAITMGDHIYKKRELMKVLAAEQCICKPANFPREAPGREFVVVPARDGHPVAIFSLLGRLFMRPVDCPFSAADRVLGHLNGQTHCILVDLHAEATGDKALLGRYLDGRISAAVGTHTHVPTADEQILPGGTAFITDVGMTGPYDGILGRRADRVLQTTMTFIPTPFDVATGDPRLAGVLIDIDAASGRATGISRLSVREQDLREVLPETPRSGPTPAESTSGASTMP